MANDGKEKKDKQYEIIVNGEMHTVENPVVSYEQVVAMAFPEPPAPNTVFHVTYRHAKGDKKGSLVAGASVEVKKKDTVFNVKPTGKS
jgi:hypothetical protein